MGPPAAASGETWPMAAPRVAPEKRPSVMRATEPLIRSSHTMASVVMSISGMPQPAGALIADDDHLAGIDLVGHHGVVGVLLVVEDTGHSVDHLALINGAGGVLQDAALGGQIALQDGHGALLGALSTGKMTWSRSRP